VVDLSDIHYYMRPRPAAHIYMHINVAYSIANIFAPATHTSGVISPGLPSCIANALEHQLQGFLQFLQLELCFM